MVHPEIRYRETEFTFEMPDPDETLNCQQMLVAMREDRDRNDIIKAAIRECIREPTIILSDSLDHLEELMRWTVETTGIPCAYINGSTNRTGESPGEHARRPCADAFCDIPAGKNLGSTSRDSPASSWPRRNETKTSIQQAVGRIIRPDPGKSPPAVYDILDNQMRTLKNWSGQTPGSLRLGPHTELLDLTRKARN